MSNQRKFNHHDIISRLLRTALEHDDQQEAFSDLTFELVQAIGYLVGSAEKQEDRDLFIKEINSQINDCIELLDGVRQELGSKSATLVA
jgi:hypothetical protein